MPGRKLLLICLVILGMAAVAAYFLLGPPAVLARSSTPDYCSSCHVMEAEFEAWRLTGAHRGILCVDCHLPNQNAPAHYFWKSVDGLKDMVFFYSGRVPERIRISEHGQNVMQVNCIRCHAETVAKIDVERQCWSCHRTSAAPPERCRGNAVARRGGKRHKRGRRRRRSTEGRAGEMRKDIPLIKSIFLLLGAAALLFSGCSPDKPEAVKPVKIAEGEMDPAAWGKAYPINYDLWKQTGEPTPVGKSRYRRGWDTDRITWDKLSEYPYLALLFNGWGFGVAYNEPRGHIYMIKDQLDIDPSRVGAGGVCLTCKTPYASKLEKEMGPAYYKNPYLEVLAKIPEKHRELGVACVDCHDSKDMSLRISREFTLGKALSEIGVERSKLTRQEMRSLVCAQCHVTYSVTKDDQGKSNGAYFPWHGSAMGKITIENIISQLRSDPTAGEWKQKVTGFKLAFIRHPEYELFSNDSLHWKVGAACTDCHMPYTRVGAAKVSDHRVTSPLKEDLKACRQCHAEDQEWLRQRVYDIQDHTVSLQIRAGMATAVVAKLFETANQAAAEGKTVDQALYNKAKDFYLEAFYRTIFIGAENSVGFHNPSEAARVLGDAVAFAGRAEGLLRQGLAEVGMKVPVQVDLELPKYLNDRGKTRQQFKPEQEVKDPFGIQQRVSAGL